MRSVQCVGGRAVEFGAKTRTSRRCIDLDAGTIVTGDETVEEVGERLFELFVETASGATTASERFGFGEEEAWEEKP